MKHLIFSKEISKFIHFIYRFGSILFILSISNLYASPKTSTIPSELKTKQGHWKITEVLWDETSGPVAPEFHYAKQIRIEANAKGFFFSRRETNQKSEPTQTTKRIDQNTYAKLLNDLLRKDALRFAYETTPPKKITGISYNFFSIRVGTRRSRFFYVLKDLEKKEFKKKKEIIQIMERIKL